MKLKHLTLNFHTFHHMTTREYRIALNNWCMKRNDILNERLNAAGWTWQNDPNLEQHSRILNEVNKELKAEKPVIDKTACSWQLYVKDSTGLYKATPDRMTYQELVDFVTTFDAGLEDLSTNHGWIFNHIQYHAYPRKNKEVK